MRLLIVMPLGEQRGGGEAMLLHLLAARRDPEIHIHVVLLEHGPLDTEIRALGAEVTVIDAGRLRNLGRYARTVLRLRKLARDADVVFGWFPKAHLYSGLSALLARRPAAWYQLGTPSGDWLDRLATLIPARRVLTLSTAGQEAQARIWPHRTVVLVYPAADLDRFAPEALPAVDGLRDKLGLPPDPSLVIVVVARLQEWKGIHLMIEAMPKVLASHPNTVLVVVGGAHSLEPAYPARLEALIISLGLQAHVRMVGLQRNIPDWMHTADVVAVPSLGEPFGIVVVEALALGRVVVASDQGGPAEIIQDGVNGVLFKSGSVESLGEAVLRVLDDQDFRHQIRLQAPGRARDFSVPRFAEAFFAAISAL